MRAPSAQGETLGQWLVVRRGFEDQPSDNKAGVCRWACKALVEQDEGRREDKACSLHAATSQVTMTVHVSREGDQTHVIVNGMFMSLSYNLII